MTENENEILNLEDEISNYDIAANEFDKLNSMTDAALISSSRPPSNQSIDGDMMTAQDNYNIISGINEIPPRYKELAPELLTTLITYNNIIGDAAKAEWQIKTRNNLRKRQMYMSDSPITGIDIPVITYFNDLLLTRGTNGFERKMSISTLSGVMSEAELESAPRSANIQQKKGFLASIFGGHS
ncbi:MAG: hypothetical protein M0R51_14450 [Clostridia bacterium]|jgi:hypothetical protein|nr:hypothetical protein [Clostridia bacterium]